MVLHDVVLHALLSYELLLAEPVDGLDSPAIQDALRQHVDGIAHWRHPGAPIGAVPNTLRNLPSSEVVGRLNQ